MRLGYILPCHYNPNVDLTKYTRPKQMMDINRFFGKHVFLFALDLRIIESYFCFHAGFGPVTYLGQSQPLCPWEDFQPVCSLPPSLGGGLNNDLLSNPLCENDPDHRTPGSESAVKVTPLNSNDSQHFAGLTGQDQEMFKWATGWRAGTPWVCGYARYFTHRNIQKVLVRLSFHARIAENSGMHGVMEESLCSCQTSALKQPEQSIIYGANNILRGATTKVYYVQCSLRWRRPSGQNARATLVCAPDSIPVLSWCCNASRLSALVAL